MKPERLGWSGVLLLNAIWAVLLTTRSGRAAAVLGALAAASILLSGSLPPTIRAYLKPLLQYPATLSRAAVLALAFLLPGASLIGTPVIAFFVLGGREWLLAAWLLATAAIASSEPASARDSAERSPRTLPAATALLLAAVSALWLVLVWNIGIGNYAFQANRNVDKACQSDPLLTAFNIWETQPASEHLFLGWRTTASFDRREPYANHVHPYLLTMYAVVRAVRAFAHVPSYVATNLTPFFYMAVLLAGTTTLLVRRGLLSGARTVTGVLVLLLAYGVLITTWRFWNDMYRYSTDNPYPLLVGVLLFVYAFLLQPARPLLAIVSACIFVALSPIYAPLLAVAVLALFGDQDGDARPIARRLPWVVAAGALACAAVVYLAPRALIAWKGYHPYGSPFVFRSGLDGDTRYFSNMVQAVFSPCPISCCWARTATDLIFPAFVPLALVAVAAVMTRGKTFAGVGHLLLFLCTPYLLSLILFPQAVSIHPYMYDHLLLLPVVIVGAVAMLEPQVEARLKGPWLLGFLLVASAVLMSNLIGIAQGLAAMPVRP